MWKFLIFNCWISVDNSVLPIKVISLEVASKSGSEIHVSILVFSIFVRGKVGGVKLEVKVLFLLQMQNWKSTIKYKGLEPLTPTVNVLPL